MHINLDSPGNDVGITVLRTSFWFCRKIRQKEYNTTGMDCL